MLLLPIPVQILGHPLAGQLKLTLRRLARFLHETTHHYNPLSSLKEPGGAGDIFAPYPQLEQPPAKRFAQRRAMLLTTAQLVQPGHQ